MTHSDMGGFSKAPKFPQPVNFNFLFTYYAANPKDDKGKQGLKMALHTLDMMARGGIHDHISQVCTKPRTMDAQWSLFPLKSQAFWLEQISFWDIWGILGQTISTHFCTVSPLSMFSIIQQLFLKKKIPNIYLGLGFEFGLQRIRDLAFVCL